MEEQIIKTIKSPSVSLKKFKDGLGWEISSSSKDDLPKIKEIIETIEKANNLMEEKFGEKE